MADQLVDCIANDRDRTVQELLVLAERMSTEGAAERSAFAWGQLPPRSADRLLAIRAAQLALGGNSESTTREAER